MQSAAASRSGRGWRGPPKPSLSIGAELAPEGRVLAGLGLVFGGADLTTQLKARIVTEAGPGHRGSRLSGCGTLFGLARVSSVVEGIKEAVDGRLLVFFPGEHHPENHTYRLLDARDGWNYLAVPAGPGLTPAQILQKYAKPPCSTETFTTHSRKKNRCLVNNGVAEVSEDHLRPRRPFCATNWRPLFATASTKKG